MPECCAEALNPSIIFFYYVATFTFGYILPDESEPVYICACQRWAWCQKFCAVCGTGPSCGLLISNFSCGSILFNKCFTCGSGWDPLVPTCGTVSDVVCSSTVPNIICGQYRSTMYRTLAPQVPIYGACICFKKWPCRREWVILHPRFHTLAPTLYTYFNTNTHTRTHTHTHTHSHAPHTLTEVHTHTPTVSSVPECR